MSDVVTTAALLGWLKRHALLRQTGAILTLLRDHGWHTRDELVMAMYGGEDEPNTAEDILRHLVHMLRVNGVAIESQRTRGYRRPPTDERPYHPPLKWIVACKKRGGSSFRYCDPTNPDNESCPTASP